MGRSEAGTIRPRSDESLTDAPRLNATATLDKIASEFPDAAVDQTDAVAVLLDADNHRRQTNAVGVLSDFGTDYVGALEPCVEALASLLDADVD